MMANIGIIFLFLIVSIIDAKGHPIIALDIGKRDGYDSGSHKITVEKHDVLNAKDSQVFYKHLVPAESRLAELTLDGQYIHSDFIPPYDDHVLHSMVYWRNDKPDMVAIRFDKEEIILWNNGNGRLISQASSIFTYPNILDRQVVLDIGRSVEGRYGTSSITARTDMFIYPFTEPELPGYQICRHTGPPFMVKDVWNGSVLTDIKVVPEVHNVYVYKWNNVPLLVDFELFNGKVLSFAYLDKKWKAVKSPKNDDYKRMHYLRELLGYINCRLGNRVIIDIQVQNNSKYSRDTCKFLDLPVVNRASITVETYSHNYGDLKDFKEYRHKVRNGAIFDIKHIVNGDNRVIINLPNKPVKSFSYFKKGKDKGLLLYIVIVTTYGEHPYEYYKHNGGEEFVKYAVSDRSLGSKDNFLRHERGKVCVWRYGRLIRIE